MAAHRKECAAKGAPEIGMSKERVLTTCWGKPSHVNRTTTASGSREQMVYGLCSAERHNASHSNCQSYIYLTNGVITGIEN